MTDFPLIPAHDHFLDYLVSKATPQEILAYEIPESERERTLELLDKQEEGTLSEAEEAELEQIAQMELLLMSLYAKAKRAIRLASDADS
jgi:hypothetical protein